ncbi:putative GMC oxidoreductase [Nemania sp. NC0429]|nr:putative GMC oxidoreductase [Nemania sp. NC0429]
MASTSTVDYIIIGGGTSGLVVANRLSENTETQVLVLEAGRDLTSDPRVNIPAFWTSLIGSKADWQYKTLPQADLERRCVRHPQRKALVPSYRKSYTLLPPLNQATLDHLEINWINEDYHGSSGPIKVSFPGVIQNPLCKAWIDTFKDMHKLTSADPFSGTSIGGYSNTATVDPKSKVRSYAGAAYGIPAGQRPNVRIITEAQVQKILFDESTIDTKSAKSTGVRVIVNKKIEVFNCSEEVLVAARVYNTPKILELSGIGAKQLLQQHRIKSMVDLPGVGENFQDHLITGLSYEAAEGVFTGDPLMRQEPDAFALAQKLYVESKAGPFTIKGIQSYAFMLTLGASALLNSINAQGLADPKRDSLIRSIFDSPNGSSGGKKSFVGLQLLPENYVSLRCIQLHLFFRGSTYIASADITAEPNIDPRYLSHPADIEILARHLQSLDTVLRPSTHLSQFLKPDRKRNHPDAFKVHNLEEAKKYVVNTATSAYHSCGSAAIMPLNKGGVVSPKLRVYRTSNVQVIDASIFSLIPRGNILSSVYAVAEKAADIIKSG